MCSKCGIFSCFTHYARCSGVRRCDDLLILRELNIDANANGAARGWFNGDFNYDGKVNVDDYGIIDSNVTTQGAPFFTGGGTSVPLSSVPEPTSLVLCIVLGVIGITSMTHRKRVPRKILTTGGYLCPVAKSFWTTARRAW